MLPLGAIASIERAELRVRHEPGRLGASAWSERDDAVVTLAIRADVRGEEQSAIAAESKAARKRYDPARQDMLAGGVERGENAMTVRLLRNPT